MCAVVTSWTSSSDLHSALMLSYGCVLVRVSKAVIKKKPLAKSNLKKIYFILQLSAHAASLRDVLTGTQHRS